MMLGVGQLRDFAAHYTAAWCSGDPARVAACYAPNGSLTINGGAPSSGRIEIMEAALGFMSTFPDLRVIMDDVLVKDKYAEFHWTLTGTNSGAGGTGNRVRISGFEVWTLGEDGLIAESRGHFDNEEYERQLKGGRLGPE
jgi:predicted ester cyclase